MSYTTSEDDSSSLHDLSTGVDHGVGLSNPKISQRRREMLDLMNRLFNTGVEIDIDLPQIAVIGSQSAGKSSLIESISGITLPRASGTCTRCPTECRLAHSENAWSCAVSLRLFEDGKVRNEKFGSDINDKACVEERIRKAQRAILNPTIRKQKGIKYFLEDSNDDESSASLELTFSNDCVSLQISGPDVSDLSFCDLPGLIAGVGRGGNANDIDLVKSLVTSYIKRPSCIVLLTVACETDFQNQGAQELAKIYDPDGKRTIGVLTKPDRIPAGEESNWLGFIRNEKEYLHNGWFCVKQPSSNDLKAGISWKEARSRENEFFSLTSPWSDLDTIYQKYLRTENLVERLSAILSDLISKRLPEIQRELEDAILTTHKDLNMLPKEPSSTPSNEIANLLHEFVRDLTRHVAGVPDKEGLLQSIRPAQEEFRRAIRLTAPSFQPFERRYSGLKSIGKAEFLIAEEGGEDILDEKADHTESDGSIFKFTASTKYHIYIDEVLERAHQARTRELPGNYPFVVQEAFMKTFIEQWRAPAHTLCRSVYYILGEKIKQLIHIHFESFGQGLLEQRIQVFLHDHINKCMEQTKQRIDWLLDLENSPFTLNTHYLRDYKDKFLAYYKGAREKDRNANLMAAIRDYAPPIYGKHARMSVSNEPTGVAKVLAGLVEIGINGVKPEELAKLIPQDGMEPALNIMADVRAYFQVAYKRVADNIPLAIDHELVHGIERNVLQILNVNLGINGPNGQEICKILAQENPSIAGRREELTKRLERMYAGSQELLRIF